MASLRRACVEVDVIGLEALAGTVTADSPAAPNLKVTLLVSNTGAQATLITAIDVLGLEAGGLSATVRGGTPTEFPQVMKGSDAGSHEYVLYAQYRINQRAATLQEFAECVAGLGEVDISVRRQFIRSAGLPITQKWLRTRLPKRLRHHRQKVCIDDRLSTDAGSYRASLATLWRDSHRADLANQVQAAEPASDS